MTRRDLSGTVTLVTGAASGIGAATARALLDAGGRVVGCDREAAALDSLAATLDPECFVAVAGDVGCAETGVRALEAGVSAWGAVDGVVANAGVGWFGGVLDQTEEQIEAMCRTNLLGTIRIARAAVAHFRRRGTGGDIVVMSSAAGLGHGGAGEATYAATKAGQVQFARSLDREVASEGIRVTTIAPAAVNTTFAAATGRFGDVPPEEGPFLHPEDVASTVVTVLEQPRRVRTAVWSLWSQGEPLR